MKGGMSALTQDCGNNFKDREGTTKRLDKIKEM
jgi:hypothetical protein